MHRFLHAVKAKLYFIVARYFAFWAKFVLRRWRPKTVVITGSTGKTTAFCLAEAQLGEMAKYSHDANSAFGIPFDILGLKRRSYSIFEWVKFIFLAPFRAFSHTPKQKIYVAECDTDRLGEGKFLATLLKPHVVLWLNSTETHAEKFASAKNAKKAIARDYGWFVEMAQELVVVDGDDKVIATELDRAPKSVKVEKYSEKHELADYMIDKNGTEFKLKDFTAHVSALVPRAVWLPIIFTHRLTEIFEAEFDVNFAKMKMPAGRSSLFSGIKDTVLVDSSYNSSLLAAVEMMEMFAKYPAKNKWIVISDILESGVEEKRVHRELAAEILKHDWQKVILVGRRMLKYVAPILDEAGAGAMSFSKTEQAYNYIYRQIQGGEAILFKGSQFLEMAVAGLLKNKADEKNLPRRGAVWDKKRLGYSGKLKFTPPKPEISSLKNSPEVIILPGWTYNDYLWRPLIDEMNQFGAKTSILRVPGLTGEKITKPWTLEDYVAWLKDELKNKKNLVLVGHSNGCRILERYLAKNLDERVRGTVLIGAAGLPDRRFNKVIKRTIALWMSKIGKKLTGNNPKLKKLFYRLIREHDYEEANEVMKKTMQNVLSENLADELAEIGQTKIKKLLVWGKNDDYTPLVNGRKMAELLNCRIKVLSARHSPQFTNLDEVLVILAKFLEEV